MCSQREWGVERRTLRASSANFESTMEKNAEVNSTVLTPMRLIAVRTQERTLYACLPYTLAILKQ